MVFYRSFYECAKELPEGQRVKLYDAILAYALENEEPTELSGILRGIFQLIKPQIDANNKRFENGKRGGRPKNTDNSEEHEEGRNGSSSSRTEAGRDGTSASQNQKKDKEAGRDGTSASKKTTGYQKQETKKTTGYQKQETKKTIGYQNRKPNVNVNVNENDNVNVNANEREISKNVHFVPPTLDNVMEYSRELGTVGFDAQHFIDYYTSISWKTSAGASIIDWRSKVRDWVRRDKEAGRKGISASKSTKQNTFTNFPQRNYDAQALERQLLGEQLKGQMEIEDYPELMP